MNHNSFDQCEMVVLCKRDFLLQKKRSERWKKAPLFSPWDKRTALFFFFFLVSSEKEESLDLGTWNTEQKERKELVWVPKVSRVLSLNLQPRTLSNYVPFWIFVAPCIMCFFCPATFTSNHICIISPKIKQNPVSKKYSKLIRNLVKSHSSPPRHITQPKGETRFLLANARFFCPSLPLFLSPYIG